MLQSYKTSYLVDSYLDLFKKYQSTTLNLRILWVDQVSNFTLCSVVSANCGLRYAGIAYLIIQIISMDRDHSKFVLTGGFDQFWRGISQKERMYVLYSSCKSQPDHGFTGRHSLVMEFSTVMTRQVLKN
jgi:hypothetical protein